MCASLFCDVLCYFNVYFLFIYSFRWSTAVVKRFLLLRSKRPVRATRISKKSSVLVRPTLSTRNPSAWWLWSMRINRVSIWTHCMRIWKIGCIDPSGPRWLSSVTKDCPRMRPVSDYCLLIIVYFMVYWLEQKIDCLVVTSVALVWYHLKWFFLFLSVSFAGKILRIKFAERTNISSIDEESPAHTR